MPLKKFRSILLFEWNFKHRALTACTTTILNSSAMSEMKFDICFISRSTEDSEPVFRRVVIARVAIFLFESPINVSKSSLHFDTTPGYFIATSFRVLAAANRRVGLGELRNNCNTVIAGKMSLDATSGKRHIALAASYITISFLCLKQLPRNSYAACAFVALRSSCNNREVYLTNKQTARGDRGDDLENCVTNRPMAKRS
mmetsp:Transcript_455/g.679  ORF Transcript_455/g.679 Transcript_455/m.679 type:complete len:200 (-) Transcript_455:23-622(-)